VSFNNDVRSDFESRTDSTVVTTNSIVVTVVGLAGTGGSVIATHSSGGGYLVEEDTMTEGVGQVKLITWVKPFLTDEFSETSVCESSPGTVSA
jgi:hypothetical protein